MRKLKVKDFDIRPVRTGTRILGSAEWVYRIFLNGKDTEKEFALKKDAQRFVSRFVKAYNTKIQ